jgi:hypothetical protein
LKKYNQIATAAIFGNYYTTIHCSQMVQEYFVQLQQLLFTDELLLRMKLTSSKLKIFPTEYNKEGEAS